MKKSELRNIIRNVLREADVVDKKYTTDPPVADNIWCKIGCAAYLHLYPDYFGCVRACNARLFGERKRIIK